METELLRHKVFEPVMLLGRDKYSMLDIRVRVKGGGHVSQAYAIRQALAKCLVAFYQKCAFTQLTACYDALFTTSVDAAIESYCCNHLR